MGPGGDTDAIHDDVVEAHRQEVLSRTDFEQRDAQQRIQLQIEGDLEFSGHVVESHRRRGGLFGEIEVGGQPIPGVPFDLHRPLGATDEIDRERFRLGEHPPQRGDEMTELQLGVNFDIYQTIIGNIRKLVR
ncbi:hypothetical protein GCM10023319_52650 [Nocardia iowensis]